MASALMCAADHPLLSLLSQLSDAAEAAAKPIRDPGGGNARPFFGMRPEYEVAFGCADLFERLRPGDASRLNKDFQGLVSLVWEAVSDQADADLERPVKQALRRYRKQGGREGPGPIPPK